MTQQHKSLPGTDTSGTRTTFPSKLRAQALLHSLPGLSCDSVLHHGGSGGAGNAAIANATLGIRAGGRGPRGGAERAESGRAWRSRAGRAESSSKVEAGGFRGLMAEMPDTPPAWALRVRPVPVLSGIPVPFDDEV